MAAKSHRSVVRGVVRSAACCVVTAFFAGACAGGPTADPELASTPVRGGISDTWPTDGAYPLPRMTQEAMNATPPAIEQDSRATVAVVGMLTPVGAIDMVTYSSPVLGISFAYPAELGDASLDMHAVPRDSSNCCAWSIYFSRFDGLVFGGASVDLRDNSPWALGFTRGEDGRFLGLSTLFPEGGEPMDVVEVLQVNGRDILMHEEGGASLNLAGAEFPGGGVWADTTRLPVETFRAILSTIRVWPPTLPVQTSAPSETPPKR